MIEIITVIGLLLLVTYLEISHRQERKKLLEMIMSKNLLEFKHGEKIEKEKPKQEFLEVPAKYIPMSEATDDQFEKAIQKELGRESVLSKAKESLKKRVKHG